jgi:predicted TIM-barrel fold metal-dependent hydrolase
MRKGHRIIDSDRHLMEPGDLWERYLEAKYRERAPIQVGQWSTTWVVDGIQNNSGTSGPKNFNELFNGRPREELRKVRAGFWTRPAWRRVYYDAIQDGFSSRSYLADMDRSAVDAAVCFGTAILYFNWRDKLDADFVVAACRAYNDWLHDYCAVDRKRVFAIASLPMHDLAAAEREAVRAVEKLGHVGFFLRPNPLLGRSWHDPVYDRFFSVAEDLGKPVCFHEGAGTIMPQARLPYGRSFHLRHAMSHPFEQMLACLSMAGLGVLERHPRLKVFFAESTCGWVPFWLERLDRLYESKELGPGPTLKEKPSFYFRRQGAVSCESGEESLPSFVSHVGNQNIMWASDYPHPDEVMKFPGTVDPMLDDGGITQETVRRILWDNPNAFFGLGLD